MRTKVAQKCASQGHHELTVSNWGERDEMMDYSHNNNNNNNNNYSNFAANAYAPVAAAAASRYAVPPGVAQAINESGNVTEGKAELGLVEFLKLVESGVVPKDQPPQENALVRSAKYFGSSEKDCLSLKCEFVVQLLSKRWTSVRLLPATVACRSSSVSLMELATFDDPTATEELNKSNISGAKTSVVCVRQNAYCLVAEEARTYRVQMEVVSPFLSEHIRGIHINVPQAVENELEFRVKGEETSVTCDPSTISTQEKTSDGVIFRSSFPPTTTLRIHVTKKVDDEEEEEDEEEENIAAKEEEIVTAEQFSLFGVGEGVVRGTTKITFTLAHGSRSVFEIALESGLRIMQVTGPNIKRWDVGSAARFAPTPHMTSSSSTDSFALVDHEEGGGGAAAAGAAFGGDVSRASSMNSLPPSAPATGRVLKVWLDFATDAQYTLTIDSELEMKSTSAAVELPRFICRNVNRDKGSMAVEARTNVEIAELNSSGVAKLDPSELPLTVVSMARHPVLHAYKFLVSSSVHVKLDVKKHKDISVLIATIDVAYLRVCCSDAKLLYQLSLSVRNTSKQFIRIDIPAEANVWSTSVRGRAVKPAKDADGKIMIPLEKSRGSGDETFTVELAYIYALPSRLQGSGRVLFNVPSMDIPISCLLVSTFLPKGFLFGEFEGPLKEVTSFSVGLPVSEMGSMGGGGVVRARAMVRANVAQQVQMPQMQMPQMQMPQMPMPMSQNYEDDAPRGDASEGLMPVRVEVPTTGTHFQFERFLVDREKFEMSVRYKEMKKPFFGRRVMISPQIRLGLTAASVAAVAIVLRAISAYFWR